MLEHSNLSNFSNLLLRNNVIWRPLLAKVMKRMEEIDEKTPSMMAKILVHDFNIEHNMVYEKLAEMYAFRKIEIDSASVAKEEINDIEAVLNKFSTEFRKKLLYHKIFPYRIVDELQNILLVLSADPTNKLAKEIPHESPFKKFEIAYCPLEQLNKLIDVVSPEKNEFLELLEESGEEVLDFSEEHKKKVDEKELENKITKSALVNLYEAALLEAVRKGASDVHIIPFDKKTVDIFFRIDGKLQLWYRQENSPPEALTAVAKDRSVGIDRFERDIDQDGFAQRTIDNHIIRFRVSVIPIISSEYERRLESIVIRVIDDRKVITDFKKLGFQQLAEKEFFKAISSSKGIVIVTGPTGSGKSTTLMAALHHVIDPSKNVLTCEDSVEYVIRGARQIKISNKMTFDRAIRSILRHDPDVVMVGEIRDKETADIAVKLANTGHLTLATLHTNDAPSAVSRLYKMGVEPFLLAYSINIIIAQRLVRKLCSHCKKPLTEKKWTAAMEFGFTKKELEEGKVQEAVGCDKCANGFKGRINIAEALYFHNDICEAIVKAGEMIDEEQIKKLAKGHGMLTMRESGMHRIRAGLTTLEEVAYATSEK
jgi:type IV pilus assembly protein PilB